MNAATPAAPSTNVESTDHGKRPVLSCPVCDDHRFRYLFSIENHRLVRCRECHFTFLNPQPSEQEFAAISASPSNLPANAQNAREISRSPVDSPIPAKYLDALIAYNGSSRRNLLQIGYDNTSLSVAATEREFDVVNTDDFPHAKNLSGKNVGTDLDTLADTGRRFDICIVTNTLERSRDPRHLIRTLHRLLRPGGVLFVATPDFSFGRDRAASRSAKFTPQHLSYFTRRTLESLLFAQGFRELAWESCELPPNENRIVPGGIMIMGRAIEKKPRPLLSIIVPVFNEAATFRTAFERLLAHPFAGCDVEYLVVESNSTDGTRDIVNEYASHPRVRVLLEDAPRGKGHAVRTGLKVCHGDFIAIQDADLEYDVDDYDALLEPLLKNREAFVLGARHGGRSRKMRQFAGQPLTSGILNFGHWFFTTLLNLFLGVRLKDPFTMYKLFRRDCIHDLEFEANRFDFDWELVIKLIRKGYIPIEIPVNYRSRSFHEGKKVRVIRDPLSWFAALAKFRFQRLKKTAPSATRLASETR